MIVRVKEVVSYRGHSLSANGSVNLTFSAVYSELVNTIQLTQMLNNDIVVKAKVPDQKPMKLGLFRLKQITIDHDGESKVKLNGLVDYIEIDNLNTLPLKNDDCNSFVIMLEAEIEEEDEE